MAVKLDEIRKHGHILTRGGMWARRRLKMTGAF